MSVVSEDLGAMLSLVIPGTSAADLTSSLHQHIIEPGAEMAHKLHLSLSVFSLKWPARRPWARLEVFDCINLQDCSHVQSRDSDRIAYLFDLMPGLFIERISHDKQSAPKAICKPTVLVHVGHGDLPEQLNLVSWIWEYANMSAAARSREPGSRSATPRHL